MSIQESSQSPYLLVLRCMVGLGKDRDGPQTLFFNAKKITVILIIEKNFFFL